MPIQNVPATTTPTLDGLTIAILAIIVSQLPGTWKMINNLLASRASIKQEEATTLQIMNRELERLTGRVTVLEESQDRFQKERKQEQDTHAQEMNERNNKIAEGIKQMEDLTKDNRTLTTANTTLTTTNESQEAELIALRAEREQLLREKQALQEQLEQERQARIAAEEKLKVYETAPVAIVPSEPPKETETPVTEPTPDPVVPIDSPAPSTGTPPEEIKPDAT